MRKGFSLTETIVVLFVFSLVLGISFMSFSKLLKLSDSLFQSALILSQDIRGLQLSSILARNYSYLYLDFYTMKKYILKYPDSKLVERPLPKGIKLSSSSFGERGYLSFSPTGSPLEGGYIALSDGRRKLYVIVAVFTGRVRISESFP
ncbi:MAG: prepilin-type N-terminal cleavage/methylation domain-containing protein [Synergistetes bacterium]|nr:prepilin-type N-terminal cleavage/methylation domain-containing protein [Synergistota bacterium]MDK2871623.1 hypothetical protein [bacterium]